MIFFCVGVVFSGEYDVGDVTLSVYPHQASLKNMPGHGGNRFPPWQGIFFKLAGCGYTLRVTSQTSYSPEYTTPTQKKIILLDYIGIEGTRFCSEISLPRTDLTVKLSW